MLGDKTRFSTTSRHQLERDMIFKVNLIYLIVRIACVFLRFRDNICLGFFGINVRLDRDENVGLFFQNKL